MHGSDKDIQSAGLQISSVIIKNPDIRKKYSEYMTASGFDYGEAGVFGLEAMRAAYNYGGEWLDSLMEYLKGSLDFLCDYVEKNIQRQR